MVDVITRFASDWASTYANSAVIRTGVGFAHVAGLVGGAGAAITADRGILRAARGDAALQTRRLADLHATHLGVLVSLGAVIASGILLMLADLETYWGSTVFWLKMSGFALLAVNGATMMRASNRAVPGEPATWTSLRATAVVSLVLWTVTTLLGAALPNVG